MDKTEIGSVCFVITGEYLTNLSRSFWVEGDYPRAIRILMNAVIGLSLEHAIDILRGTKQLTGDSTKGIGIESDSAKHDPLDVFRVGYMADIMHIIRKAMTACNESVKIHESLTTTTRILTISDHKDDPWNIDGRDLIKNLDQHVRDCCGRKGLDLPVRLLMQDEEAEEERLWRIRDRENKARDARRLARTLQQTREGRPSEMVS